MSKAKITAIEFFLPERVLDNEHLAEIFPEWTSEKIETKTGISQRWVSGEDECSSDLGFGAAKKLIESGVCDRGEIDFLLFCTQSPDYLLPTSACILQERLGLPTGIGALDFNLGCSGYVYGLGLASGLIATEQAKTVLLITAETYTKFIHPKDRSVRTLFGDGAAATLIRASVDEQLGGQLSGPFLYGTDGRGAANLIVPYGGMRDRNSIANSLESIDKSGNVRSGQNLFMNGGEIFSFTLDAVPKAVNELLRRSGKTADDVDLFVFHQANEYMLEHLRKRMKIPREKFYICLKHVGNTVSSTIPIALKHAMDDGTIRSGSTVMLVGFGVGYSWGATLVRW